MRPSRLDDGCGRKPGLRGGFYGGSGSRGRRWSGAGSTGHRRACSPYPCAAGRCRRAWSGRDTKEAETEPMSRRPSGPRQGRVAYFGRQKRAGGHLQQRNCALDILVICISEGFASCFRCSVGTLREKDETRQGQESRWAPSTPSLRGWVGPVGPPLDRSPARRSRSPDAPLRPRPEATGRWKIVGSVLPVARRIVEEDADVQPTTRSARREAARRTSAAPAIMAPFPANPPACAGPTRTGSLASMTCAAALRPRLVPCAHTGGRIAALAPARAAF